MEKLDQLIRRCRCGIYLTFNEHKDFYETAEQRLKDARDYISPPDIEEEVREKMIKTNTIIICHFYSDNPVGSYEVWHYDLDKCIEECLKCLEEE